MIKTNIPIHPTIRSLVYLLFGPFYHSSYEASAGPRAKAAATAPGAWKNGLNFAKKLLIIVLFSFLLCEPVLAVMVHIRLKKRIYNFIFKLKLSSPYSKN